MRRIKRKTTPIDSFERSHSQSWEASLHHQRGSKMSQMKKCPSVKAKYTHVGHQKMIAFILLACAVAVAVLIAIRLYDYNQARLEYASLREAAGDLELGKENPVDSEYFAPSNTEPIEMLSNALTEPEPTNTPVPFYSATVRGYQRQNSDTVAYIDVPNTTVQYPVVQTKNNDYYTDHSFAKRKRAAGAIFLDAWNSSDFTDFNTVIYGHNMKDGSMFSELRDYRHKGFLSNHKYIHVTLLKSRRTYKVIAAYVVEDDFDFRGFSKTTAADRASFIAQITRRSELQTNTIATADDLLLTLVTCTGGDNDWYWVVHAVLDKVVTTVQD